MDSPVSVLGQKRLFSNRDLWRLIWPLMIEQFLAITLGMADIIMVGSLGEAAVSGVSLVDNIQILIVNIFAALATGGAVVCAQYIGSRQDEMVSKTAKQLIYAVVLVAVVTMTVCLLTRRPLLSLIFGRIDADVMDNAQTYFMLMMFGLPSIALYNGCAALFRAQGNSRISMYIAALVNVINIGGNAFFIYGLHWGVAGVAVPTLAARTVAAGVLLFLLYRNKPYKGAPAINIKGILAVKPDFRIIKHILAIGIPNGLENSMFQVGKILVITLIATFGTGAIAANAAANTIASFEVLPAAAIGLAMLTVVGQCIGAGRLEEAKYFTRKLTGMGYAGMLILNVPLLFFARRIISVYGLSADTTDLAWKMLMCHGICGMLVWPLSFTLPNALRASNDAKFTMVVSLLSMWFIRVGLSYVFAWYTGLGALCSWVAMVIDWVARSGAFVVRFRRGKWQHKTLI
ncbi:MATE family efflux transporter [Treponema brennaborense]|uniref:Multidrug-efflux transporter n=1 Tax=Treponema brennaborense (strain DSM 12168 / CIP 105900 / DD5/3) TaxID=906968 RepID=F4LKL9_TREBD|nr:MATE family efflux transporter [Treponema brennaborense]AEE17575.1 MATE efflux family protein [Treponema brennaborense DSM 12168]